jgi:hypothetical protein
MITKQRWTGSEPPMPGDYSPKHGRVTDESIIEYVQKTLRDAYRAADGLSIAEITRSIARELGLGEVRVDYLRRGKAKPTAAEFEIIRRHYRRTKPAGVISETRFGHLFFLENLVPSRMNNHAVLQYAMARQRLFAGLGGVPTIGDMAEDIGRFPVSMGLILTRRSNGLLVDRQAVQPPTNISGTHITGLPLTEHPWADLTAALTHASMGAIMTCAPYAGCMRHWLGSRQAVCDFVALPVAEQLGEPPNSVIILGVDLICPLELGVGPLSNCLDGLSRNGRAVHVKGTASAAIKCAADEVEATKTVGTDKPLAVLEPSTNGVDGGDFRPRDQRGELSTPCHDHVEARDAGISAGGERTLNPNEPGWAGNAGLQAQIAARSQQSPQVVGSADLSNPNDIHCDGLSPAAEEQRCRLAETEAHLLAVEQERQGLADKIAVSRRPHVPVVGLNGRVDPRACEDGGDLGLKPGNWVDGSNASHMSCS